jgi:hypothetical protein
VAVFNQYSLLLTLVGGGLLAAVIIWKWSRPALALPVRIALMVAYGVVAVLIVLSVRYPVTTVASVADIDSALADGRPTFVMLYSNY